MTTHRIAKEGFVMAGQPIAVGTLIHEGNIAPHALRTLEESGLIERITEQAVDTVVEKVEEVIEKVEEVIEEVIEKVEEVIETAVEAVVKKAVAKKAPAPKKPAPKKPAPKK
jgi:predicted transcriptional regulator